MSVDLPAPFSPSSACTSPSLTSEADVLQHFHADERLRHAGHDHEGKSRSAAHSHLLARRRPIPFGQFPPAVAVGFEPGDAAGGYR